MERNNEILVIGVGELGLLRLNKTESFIGFIASYLLGETEEFYFNSEIFVYLLDGYSFYHDRFKGSLSDIRKFLYELSKDFLECLDK